MKKYIVSLLITLVGEALFLYATGWSILGLIALNGIILIVFGEMVWIYKNEN